jgi:UDP-N-acetylmuramoylalanine--D-glutamate ligase
MENGRIVVLGGGESGVGAAVLAKVKGFDVFLSDLGALKDSYKETLALHGIPFEEKQHTEELILNASEVVKSPGIPDKAPMVVKIREKGIRVISEIEFAGRYTTAKKICITGSNGKTTTTSLIYHMLKKAGLNVGLGGNIGKSFAYQVAFENYEYYVLELSSFQLDGMYDFRADIAVLLNITPDHLDRYDYKMQNYADSKFRITQNLRENDCFIFCSDDEVTMENLEKIVLRAKLLPFSQEIEVEEGAYLDGETLTVRYGNLEFEMPVEELSLKGKHNVYNSMAAAITGTVLELRNDVIRKSLSDFQGVEHRLEPVLKVRGITFINDSKATNINSTWYALESMKGRQNVIWIVGGVDKGNDYSTLANLVNEKVKAIVCLGLDNSKIHAAFRDMIPTIIDTNSADEAVKEAYKLGVDGDVVLLSPACASFDLFDNYEDRGRKFKNAVRNL